MKKTFPEVSGFNIINVPSDMPSKQIKTFMDDWIDQHPDVTSDPGQIVIFSPYQMFYKLDKVNGVDQLELTGFMDRDKWATLSDANDLRNFALQLEKNHKNLKVKVTLALSIKEYEEDNDFNFVNAYFAKNKEVREMISKMNTEEEDENLFGDD
jgi:hypothetical protein